MLLGIPATTKAQSTYNPSPDHDFALAYYKLAGTQPNFKAIARNMKAYETAEEREKPDTLQRLDKSLRKRFADLEPDQKLLTLQTTLRMDVKRQPKKDKATLHLKLPENRPLYFPMQPGKRRIAVIMKNFKRFRDIPLEGHEANYVDSRASDEEDITMYLQLQPVDADARQPVKLDGVAQWPLLTRIARMGLYNRDDETIWEYKAQWFTTEQGDEVRELFRK